MQKPKAIIIDLDGTLLNDNKQVSESDLQVLNSIGKRGVIRIIATGRSLFSFNEVLDNNFPIDYLIFDAGAGIMDFKTKEIISSHFIQTDDVLKIAKLLDDLKIDFQIRDKIPNSHKYSFKKYSKINTDFERVNSLYKFHSLELSNFKNLKEATRFICISEDTEIVQQIETEFSDFGIIRATSPIDKKSVWMEIYPKNVNKGSSVKKLCNLLNISLKEIVGLGNDYNDIDFLDITGKSFVVDNAPEILKEKYSTTVSNNESPLTTVVELFFDK